MTQGKHSVFALARTLFVVCCGFGLAALPCPAARASVLYETASPGGYGGASVMWNSPTNYQYVGARFHVDHPWAVDRVGGHFLAIPSSQGKIFAALIRLTGPTDVPDSVNPLTTPDVLGTTLVAIDRTRADRSGAFAGSIALDPGWYAILFGSGQFGATAAAATYGGSNVDSPSYIWSGSSANPGGYNAAGLNEIRLFVEGAPAPVPSPQLTPAALLFLAGLLSRRRRAYLANR